MVARSGLATRSSPSRWPGRSRSPPRAPGPAAVPAIATQAFDSANNTGVGSIVPTTISGITVPAKIVAVASAFPTITGAGLVMDLPALEAFLVSHGAAPVAVTQWWLATADGQVPASLTRALPPGATITSSAALAAATLADPLSAAPQQALLAMAVAAALLAIFGFWVSIAANVRQRRAENALLAALGVDQRSAAAQLFLEKLLLSVPAAALGLLLGTVVARLLVPAVTLSPTAQAPVPQPITLSTCRRRSRSRPRSPCSPRWPPRWSSSGAPTRPPSSRGGGGVSRRHRPRGLYLWLALLTFFAVFAATAGARETLASRTQAVRQTMAATLPLTRTITASGPTGVTCRAISRTQQRRRGFSTVPSATIDAITGQLHADFNRATGSPRPGRHRLVVDNDPAQPGERRTARRRRHAGQDRGNRTAAARPADAAAGGRGRRFRRRGGHRPPCLTRPTATLQVAVTRQTAAALGLQRAPRS